MDKTIRVNITMLESEKKRIKAKGRKLGLGVSAFLRYAAAVFEYGKGKSK